MYHYFWIKIDLAIEYKEHSEWIDAFPEGHTIILMPKIEAPNKQKRVVLNFLEHSKDSPSWEWKLTK